MNPSPPDSFEMTGIISSDPDQKRVGWENFLYRLPDIVSAQGSCANELLSLHEILTYGVDFPLLDSVMAHRELVMCLLYNEAPDSLQNAHIVRSQLIPKLGLEVPMDDLLRELRHYDWGFQPDLCVDIRNDIRRVGHRTYPDGHQESVFASHVLPFSVGSEIHYFSGLTKNLEVLFQDLCARFDAMRSRATTVKEIILAELYLNMIGTRMLHPFWDGNGRTFAAHLVLSLNRFGVPIQEVPQESDLHPDGAGFLLHSVTDSFLFHNLNPYFLEAADYADLQVYPWLREPYMDNLHDCIKTFIETGLMGTENEPFVRAAYHYIRLWLDKKGYLPYDCERGLNFSLLPDLTEDELAQFHGTVNLGYPDLRFLDMSHIKI